MKKNLGEIMDKIYMGVDQSLAGTGISVFKEGEEFFDLLSS